MGTCRSSSIECNVDACDEDDDDDDDVAWVSGAGVVAGDDGGDVRWGAVV